MVRIRLQRLGRRHRPFFRLNAVDQRAKLDGSVIEELGWYNPVARSGEKEYSLNEDRIRHWLSVGAQPTDTVKDILVKHGMYDADTRKAELQLRFGEKMKRVEAERKAAEEAARIEAEEKAKAEAEAKAKAEAEAKEKAAAEAAAAEGGSGEEEKPAEG